MARDTNEPRHDVHPLLEKLCSEELSHAVSHHWEELESLAPFADVCDPCADVPYLVHRTYSWSGPQGGDILCRVSVYERPDRAGQVVTRECVIRRS